MADDSQRAGRIRFMKQAAPLVMALVLGLLYIYSIHPMSGALGGAFFWIIGGWMIPSAINLLLSYFVVSFLPMRRPWKIPAFIAVSFLLGMNTLLVPLFMRNPPQPSTVEVYRPLHIPPGKRVDEGLMTPRLPGEVFGTRSPTWLGARVAGNEGCMCMWFTPPTGDTSQWHVWHVINAYLRRRDSINGTDYLGPDLARMAVGGAHFDVRFTRGKRPYTVDLLMTVYDGLEATAKYTQAGIPVWSTDPDHGHPDRLAMDQFLPTVETMLLRRNFWVFLFDDRMSGFAEEPLRAFLRQAVVRD